MRLLVKMQISAVTSIAARTMSSAESVVFWIRALAAAVANGAPEPIASSTPFLGQLNGSLAEVAIPGFELRFEFRKKGERIGNGAGEPGHHQAAVECPQLACVVLEHHVADGDLAVTGEGHLVSALDGNDRGGVGARVRFCSH
jgi:hypothetical protein